MRTDRLYKIATISLLLINMGLVLYLFSRGPRNGKKHRKGPKHQNGHIHGDHKRPMQRDILNKTAQLLQLDDTQKEQFKTLATAHHQTIKTLNEEEEKGLEQYFNGLKTSDVNQDSLLKLVSALNQEKIAITYAHFEELKALLKADQLRHFDRFVDRALMRILNPSPSGQSSQSGQSRPKKP